MSYKQFLQKLQIDQPTIKKQEPNVKLERKTYFEKCD